MNILTFSLLSASIILMSSIGFSMILKAEGFLNISHGQILLLGAYVGLLFNNIGLNIVISALLASIACGLFGVFVFRFLFVPIKPRGALVMLFTSVGLAYVINGIVGAVAGKRMLAYDLPPVRAMQIGGQPFMTVYELAIVVIAVLSALAVHLFLAHTWAGKGIRAVSDNADLARVRGIDPKRTSDTVWFAASALAGLAGVFLGIIGSLHLQMGWQQIIIVLATTVLGGLGSVYGVMLAAVVLAFGIELGLLVVPANYRSGLAFLLIIVVMLIKPEGLQALWSGGRSRNH